MSLQALLLLRVCLIAILKYTSAISFSWFIRVCMHIYIYIHILYVYPAPAQPCAASLPVARGDALLDEGFLSGSRALAQRKGKCS